MYHSHLPEIVFPQPRNPHFHSALPLLQLPETYNVEKNQSCHLLDNVYSHTLPHYQDMITIAPISYIFPCYLSELLSLSSLNYNYKIFHPNDVDYVKWIPDHYNMLR